MDTNETLENLKKLTQNFCKKRDWDKFHNPKDLVIGIVTESSELLELFRFRTIKESNKIIKDKITRQKISDEMADIFYFLLRLSQKYNIDLSIALKNKLRKNDKKYPVKKSKGNNKKYNEL